MAAEPAASARAASIVSAHTASQIISIVIILAADQPAAVAVALAVVSDALMSQVGLSGLLAQVISLCCWSRPNAGRDCNASSRPYFRLRGMIVISDPKDRK